MALNPTTTAVVVVGSGAFVTGAAFVASGLHDRLLSNVALVLSDDLLLASVGFLTLGVLGAGVLPRLRNATTMSDATEETVQEPLPSGKSVYDMISRVRGRPAGREDVVGVLDKEEASRRLQGVLTESGDKVAMGWGLAEVLVLGLRAFAATGSSKALEDAGRSLGGGSSNDHDAVLRVQEAIRTTYPFVNTSVSRNANPRVAVMRAHREAVERAGRPVPTHAVKWLKPRDRAFWYAFLNAGRGHLGTYHAEGLPGLVEAVAVAGHATKRSVAERFVDKIAADMFEPDAVR